MAPQVADPITTTGAADLSVWCSIGIVWSVGRRVRVAAALVICLLSLAACGIGPRPDGLPAPPDGAEAAASTGPITAQPPSATTLDARGPADVNLKEFTFEETGQHTVVDLERTPGTADLSYDHITGVLKPINGAKVSLYNRDDGFWESEPGVRSDYPGEQQCREKSDGDWRDVFDNLETSFNIYCIQTAENSYGFLYIVPIENQKPNAYYVYTYTWVR